MEKSTALKMVEAEVKFTEEERSSMFTPHEGWAVIKEEMDELWEEVRSGQGTTHRGVTEAVQIAAAAIRYLTDLCDEETVVDHDAKLVAWRRQQKAGRTPSLLPPDFSYPVGGFAGGYSG